MFKLRKTKPRITPDEQFVDDFLEIINAESTVASAMKLTTFLKQHDDWIRKNKAPISKCMVDKTLAVYLYAWLTTLMENTKFEKPLRQTRKQLYSILRNLTIASEPFREHLTEAYIPEVVSEDLRRLQPTYMEHAVSYIYKHFCVA